MIDTKQPDCYRNGRQCVTDQERQKGEESSRIQPITRLANRKAGMPLDEEIRVVTDNGETAAYTYVADESAVDESLRPYSWYKELLVAGARQHSLSDEYIAQLECVDADTDPDAEREKLNRESLLGNQQTDVKGYSRRRL